MSKLHRTHLFLSRKHYVEFVNTVETVFDSSDKFFNVIDIQSSFAGYFWNVVISAESFKLFMEFLSDVHMELPDLTNEELTNPEPQVVPLDEDLETKVSFTDVVETAEGDEGLPEEDIITENELDEMMEGEGDSEPRVKLKKKLLKPVSTQRVAPGVTVEDDEE